MPTFQGLHLSNALPGACPCCMLVLAAWSCGTQAARAMPRPNAIPAANEASTKAAGRPARGTQATELNRSHGLEMLDVKRCLS